MAVSGQQQHQHQQQQQLVGADGEWRRASRPLLASDSDIWLQQQDETNSQSNQDLKPLQPIRNSLSSISEFKCQQQQQQQLEQDSSSLHRQARARAYEKVLLVNGDRKSGDSEQPIEKFRGDLDRPEEVGSSASPLPLPTGSRAKSRGWSSERQHCINQSDPENMLKRQTMSMATADDHDNSIKQTSDNSQRDGDELQQQQQQLASSFCHSVQQKQQCSPLPQVTIIRSDSTYSFIPLVHGVATANINKQQPLVARLDSSGNIKSDCSEWDARNDELPNCLPNSKLSGQQAKVTTTSGGSVDDNTIGAKQQALLTSRLDLKRGLHDQLASGKVPPIQERRLLNPSSGSGNAAGLGLADSMDNLASLIPR